MTRMIAIELTIASENTRQRKTQMGLCISTATDAVWVEIAIEQETTRGLQSAAR